MWETDASDILQLCDPPKLAWFLTHLTFRQGNNTKTTQVYKYKINGKFFNKLNTISQCFDISKFLFSLYQWWLTPSKNPKSC